MLSYAPRTGPSEMAFPWAVINEQLLHTLVEKVMSWLQIMSKVAQQMCMHLRYLAW